MKTLSDLFLVIAAIASLAMSAGGFSAGVWGGFWSGTGVDGILYALMWFLPTLSVFAFVSYLLSRSVGLMCAWTIAIGSLITTCAYSLLSRPALGVFAFPLIQLIASFALYGDALIQNKITQRLTPGNEAR